MADFGLAEYIWMDGAVPTRYLRSKARAVQVGPNPSTDDFPEWSYDGSSTNQAEGGNSDCIIKPVHHVPDPIRGEGNYLVMCEVYDPDGETPHESNSRAQLRAVLDAGGKDLDMWLGFEQEYTMFSKARRAPLGWPDVGYPAPQGPYYCGVGADEVHGREVAEVHAQICMEAGLLFYGINAEVMPGQWEFQIGYRGDPKESSDAMRMCDETWLARYLLYRVAEDFDVVISTDNKPVKGDWNGAGMHTNISTKQTRDKNGGMDAINAACDALEVKHAEHIKLYGAGNDGRLTGDHETCDIHTFKSGAADRGCSIRIPRPVAAQGYGYFEDRRPGANADPYLVAARLAATLAGVDEGVMQFTSWPRKEEEFAVAAE